MVSWVVLKYMMPKRCTEHFIPVYLNAENWFYGGQCDVKLIIGPENDVTYKKELNN